MGLSGDGDGGGGVYPPLKLPPPTMKLASRTLDAATITCSSAELWEINRPKLYHLRITFKTEDGHTDTRTIAFGFRSFTVTGIDPNNPDSNAVFRLNGKRTKIYTAISWGYWGLNGMFPVPELAEKEVRSAQALGLNCLNFHRNLAKEDVLRWHDRLGVLRYMEPGAGKMAIGKLPARTDASANSVVMEKPASEADKFAQRYMFVKCVEMVKAFRSHPSVIEYCLQNELGADLKNPDTLAILKAMHDEDPSRCVVLNDGFVAPPRSAAQAWYEPWDDNLKEGKLHRSDETPFGDWWNNHQGAGDQWYDEFYKSPTDFTYNINLRNVLTEYGEMEGCARPDIHGLMVHQITETYKKYGGDSLRSRRPRRDHRRLQPLPRQVGLPQILPHTRPRLPRRRPHLLRVLAELHGERAHQRRARLRRHLRLGVHRHRKPLRHRRQPAQPQVRPAPHRRHTATHPPLRQAAFALRKLSEGAVFDLYLFNDTSTVATGELVFSVIDPENRRTELARFPLPAQQPDQFSYLLKEGFTYKPRAVVNGAPEGGYRFRCELAHYPLATQTKEVWFLNPPCGCLAGLPYTVGVSGITPAIRKQLESWGPLFVIREFTPGERYNVIISSGITSHTHADGQVGETTGLEAAPPMKPGHTPEPGEEAQIIALGHLQTGILDAVRAGTPLLAIPQTDTLSDGVAKELAAAGAFTYHGAVGDFRAPWMGNWYFVREHALFDRPPTKSAPSAASTSAKAAPPTASSSTKHLTAHPSKSSSATRATTTAMSAPAPSPRDSAKAKCSSIAAPTSTPFCSSASSPTHCAGSRPEHSRSTQRDTMKL